MNNAFRNINEYRAFYTSTNEAIDYFLDKTNDIDNMDLDSNEDNNISTFYKYLSIHIRHLDSIKELISMINEDMNVSIKICTCVLPTFLPIIQYIQETNNTISITISDIITRLHYFNPPKGKYYNSMILIYATTHSFYNMLHSHLSNVKEANNGLYSLYKDNALKDLKKDNNL